MIRVLLSIPGLLFEYIAVCAALGIIVSFFKFRKKRGIFFYIILFSICFMVAWRLTFHSLMISSRYSSILIIPSIIFAVWFCFYLNVICRWFMKYKWFSAIPHKRRICRTIPWILIVGLSIACLSKSLHYNSYSGHVQTICKAFLEDSQGKSPVYLYTPQEIEQTRIAYYCGIRDHSAVVPFKSDNPVNVSQEEFRQRICLTPNIPGFHYFFIQQKAPAPHLTAEDLSLPGGENSLREIKRVFTSRKKTGK